MQERRGKAAMQSFFMAFRNGLGVGWTASGQQQKEQIAPDRPRLASFPFRS